MQPLASRVNKLLALGLLVFALFAIVGLFRALFGLGQSAVEQLYNAQFELVQAKQRETLSRGVLATVVDAEERALVPVLMWVGPVATGETKLQEVVNHALTRAQFSLEQMRSTPVTHQGSLVRVSLDVTGSGPEASLYALLVEIERYRPVIAIERLVVRSADSMQAGQDSPAGPLLSVEMRLSSFGTVAAQAKSLSTP